MSAPAPVTAPPPNLSPEAHGRLPYIELPEISPDGRRVAFIRQFGGIRDLSVITPGQRPLVSYQKTFQTRYAGAPLPKPESLAWTDNGSLIIEYTLTLAPAKASEQPEDFWGIFLFHGLDGPGYGVTLEDVWGFVVSAPGQGDGKPYIGMGDKKAVSLMRFDKGNPNAAPLDKLARTRKGRTAGIYWYPDATGRVLTRYLVDAPPQPRFRIQVRDDPAVEWRTVWELVSDDTSERDLGESGNEGFTPLGFEADGALMGLVVGPGRRMAVAPMALSDGSIGPARLSLDKADIEGTVVDPYSQIIVGYRYADDRERVRWVDPQLATLDAAVAAMFPGQRVAMDSWSKDRLAALVEVEGPGNAGAYWLVRPGEDYRFRVGDNYPAIPPESVAPVQAYSFTARDGLKIDGFLTLPPGRRPKGLPLIVMPHGGPAARDVDAFDWWAQALAARGYAVLQPNFRGSSGQGLDFEEAGHRQWGRAMQTDLGDGVAALAADGTIDPGRVCIIGASYGGYAALAGATLTPDLYRCAVSVAGVSDLPAMIRYSQGPKRKDTFALRYWSRVIGDPVADAEALKAASPLYQVAALKAPLLLIHGRNDTTVPLAQSTAMRDAATAAGKQVSYLELEDEDHHLRREKTRTQMLAAIYDFLDRYNPADGGD
ncbi:MAG: alpha/beta fold hydrolase [Caulobacter sp.]|nr:alpha/beta fold hydrolase [Caulobacter sp.]